MTARRLMSAFSVLLALTLLSSAPAWADSNVRIVRLSLVDGPVQLDRATGEGFERAIMNMPIAQGMQLWTRDDSRGEVEFEDGTSIRLAPGTKIEFSELVLRSDGTRHTVVRVDQGRAYVNYTRSKGQDFHLQFGNRDIVLDRSVHFRLDLLADRADIAVFSGDLDLPNLRVKKNNSVAMDLAGNGPYDVAKGFNAVLEDTWDEYRNNNHDKYARNGYNGNSYYGTGGLNYYGSWFDSSYGSCWRPYGVTASWDPYSSGAWVQYPGYGYSFVSLYPWGWQPYRSGAWNYLGAGYGYCWTPNRNYYGYGYAPVYHAPSGYVTPQPPAGGTRNPRTTGVGGMGLIPVGGVNTSGNWRPTDPIILDRGGRIGCGGDSAFVSGGVRRGSNVPASGAVAGSTSTTGARNPRADRGMSPSQGGMDRREYGR